MALLNFDLKPIPPRSYWAIGGVALFASAIVFLCFFDWTWLRGPISREATRAVGRPVSIQGPIKVHLLSLSPTATVGDIKIGDPPWAPHGDLAEIPSLTVSVDLPQLLLGRLDLPLVELDRPSLSLYRDASDRANWRFGPDDGKPLSLPPIQRFVVNAGHLAMIDQLKKMTLTGSVQSSEQSTVDKRWPFVLRAEGRLNGEPFALNATGDTLLSVRQNRPYPFQADMSWGRTRVVLNGHFSRPFDFGQIAAAVTASGANFAELYYLTGVALPNSPPYRLSADMVRDGKHFTFSRVAGRVGDSDLQGRFDVSRPSNRPLIKADLRSRSLNINDLGEVAGIRPAGPTPSRPGAASPAILSDNPLNLAKLRTVDARVRYRAATVRAFHNLPLRQVAIDLSLDQGQLNATRVNFMLPHGALAGTLKLDARTTPAQETVDVKITNVRLEDFFHSKPPPVEGPFEARAILTARGDSIHRAASDANGQVTLVAGGGALRQTIAELLGINVVRGLGLLLTKDQSQTPVRCALASLQAQDGLLRTNQLIMDSDLALVKGQGVVDLRNETLNLQLTGAPKHFKLVRVRAPITVSGAWTQPHIGLAPGKAPLQGAAAVALGVVFPPATILPFVDFGLAKNADCAGLLAQARRTGAPVK